MTEKVSHIPTRIKNAKVGGHVCGATDIDAGGGKNQSEVNGDLQDQINEIVGSSATVNLAASPSLILVGNESVEIALSATASKSASSIIIGKGMQIIASGSGISLSGTNTITPTEAGDIQYGSQFIIAGVTKTKSCIVTAVYPIRTGSGAAYVDGTPLTTPKTNPAGTYNITVANDGDYVYFNVPATMTIHGATMSGFTFPLEEPQSVTIGGVAYKSYRSSNTYDAGTLTIVIS